MSSSLELRCNCSCLLGRSSQLDAVVVVVVVVAPLRVRSLGRFLAKPVGTSVREWQVGHATWDPDIDFRSSSSRHSDVCICNGRASGLQVN